MRTRIGILLLILVALATGSAAYASDHAQAPIKVVYHLDADRAGTTTALHQVKNQLAVDPSW